MFENGLIGKYRKEFLAISVIDCPPMRRVYQSTFTSLSLNDMIQPFLALASGQLLSIFCVLFELARPSL